MFIWRIQVQTKPALLQDIFVEDGKSTSTHMLARWQVTAGLIKTYIDLPSVQPAERYHEELTMLVEVLL